MSARGGFFSAMAQTPKLPVLLSPARTLTLLGATFALVSVLGGQVNAQGAAPEAAPAATGADQYRRDT